MSLFPAYSRENDDSEPKETETTPLAWLSNSSFKPPAQKSNDEKQRSPSSSSQKRKKHKREKREEKEKNEKLFFKKAEEKYHELLHNSSFQEDRLPSRNNILIPTLMKDDAPLYNKPRRCYYFDSSELKKKDKDWRYYKCSSKIFESDLTVTKQLASQTNEEILAVGNEETVILSTNLETQLSKTTASYNQQLTENPYDEDLWLQYIDFQDEIQHFEKYYRKTKGNSLASAEKKLAILDKALSHNPTSLALLNRKYEIKSEFFDAEKVSEELFNDLRQDPGNIVLWNHYIRNTQCKLSRCSVPKVKSLYAKAMEKVNFIQKDGQLSTEKHLLDLYTTSALFLRQSGLWEQFLMLMRLNLQLNLTKSPSEDYRIPINFQESNIQQMEDNMLTSGLPVYSLWLRIEKLRQRVHWFPVSNPDCEDPQRVVVATDVTDLIKPITNRSLNLRIAALTMVLLKVPLIPLRDTVFRMLSLNDTEWQMDSAEILLSIFCSSGITQERFTATEESIISCFKDLVSYPQYINDELGRDEYLEFVQNMFLRLSENLPFNCETIMLVWWLRFERSLFIAGKQPQSRKKKLKNAVKDLLKDKHRSNLPLYIEYAFLEKEFNQNNDSCIKILETALLLYPIKKNFHSLTSKNCITQLYRVFVESLLVSDKKDRCLSLLASLALSIPEKEVTLNEVTLKTALTEFQKITNQSFDEDFLLEEVFTFDHTEPQFFIEWICCHAWFLYLTESVWSASVFLDELLHKANYYEKGAPVYIGTYYREMITEILITLLHFHCKNNKTSFNVLYDSILKGIKEFPNNMLLLGTFADLEARLHFVSPWWKIEQCLRSNDSHVAKLILILLSRRRLILFEKASIDSLKILDQGGPVAASNAFSNRMRAILVKLVNDRNTRFCPLFWIIYLQYCAQYESDVKCKDVFYLAIESCPWIKTLYMEAAHALPDQVPQIQDLMIEKEIRIHITQDEIEILRDN